MTDEITPNEEVAVEAPIESVPAFVKDSSEAMSEPVQAPEEPQTEPTLNSTMESGATAQIPVNEPLEETIQTEAEKAEEPASEVIPEQVEEIKTLEPEQTTSSPEPEKEISETKNEPTPEPEKIEPIPVSTITRKNSLHELLNKARNAIQSRKRKKLDRIMTMFLKKQKITNDEVEKFLHVSDATATRYLNTLEKENKIKQEGKTGKSVFYTKI
jgi:hypothetical protein